MKKIVSVISVIIVIAVLVSVTLAAGVNGDYKGNPIINVVINGIKLTGLDVPAINYDGRTLLPLRASVEGVNGIVEWDGQTQTASVIKPETSIFFFTMNADGKTLADAFSAIPAIDPKEKFYSMINIGGIPKGTYTIKCELLNQSGTVVSYTNDLQVDIKKDKFMAEIPVAWDGIQLQREVYTFKVSMKDSKGVYKTIATKTMDYSE